MIALAALLGAVVGLAIAYAIQRTPRWRFKELPEEAAGVTAGAGRRRWPLVRAIAAAVGTAAFYALAALHHPEGAFLLAALVLGAAFILLMLIDIETRTLPDVVTAPAAVFALAISYWTIGVGASLAGGALLLVIFLIFALINLLIPGALGGGDVKLAALVGLAGGWPAGAQGLYAGVLLGGLFALFLVIARRTPLQRSIPRFIPYGPFLAAGGLIALLLASG